MDYSKKLLNVLMDKYESSKSFSGTNKVRQRFATVPEKLIRKYKDHSDYETFEGVNEAIKELEVLGFIAADKMGPSYSKVYLETSRLEDIYAYLKRRAKSEVNERLAQVLKDHIGSNELVDRYCKEQLQRVEENKSVKGFGDDVKELEDIINGINQLLKLEKETYERDFSVRLYGDSKRFKQLESKIVTILYDYGDFSEKSTLLGDLNLMKNPTYVHMKGNAVLTLAGQRLDLSPLYGGLALPSEALSCIDDIQLTGEGVVTVENLTSFHTFPENGTFIIYLGGFHNAVRRTFLKKIYQCNANSRYRHFGDIDIGGFLILEHLIKRTGIAFEAYRMGIHELQTYAAYTKPLSESDRRRAERFRETEHWPVIRYMLENNVKLEQEAVVL